MIVREGNETAVADQIDQNFYPHGHDAPSHDINFESCVRSCVIRWSDLLDRMASKRLTPAATMQGGQITAGVVSTPERGPAGAVQGIGQGRLAILVARAFELLLGFPETRDARRDFGAVARESFFLLRHRPSVSGLIR